MVTKNVISKVIYKRIYFITAPIFQTVVGARRAGSRGGVIGFGQGVSDLAGFLADESWGIGAFVYKRFY